MMSIYSHAPEHRAAPPSTTPSDAARQARDDASAVVPIAASARASSAARDGVFREGTMLGLIVAGVTWLWLLVVDAAVGDPLRTFSVLGGAPAFTVTHVGLCLLYGYVLVFAVESARKEPSAILALVFGILLLQVAFAMLSVMLSNLGLGSLAWLRIFAGSLIGLGCALAFLWRRHPLLDLYHRAEAER